MTVAEFADAFQEAALDGKPIKESYLSNFDISVMDRDEETYSVEGVKRSTATGELLLKIDGPVSAAGGIIDELDDALQDAIATLRRMSDAMTYLINTKVLDHLTEAERDAFETYEVDPISLSHDIRDLRAASLR